MIKRCLESFLCAGAIALAVNAQERDVRINEIVVDPKQDFNLDGRVSDSDEFAEIYNLSSETSYNLKGWKLELIDSTPESITLDDVVLSPKSFYVVQNPRGAQNNDGEIRLYNGAGNLVDKISYGNWNHGSGIPNGNASGSIDESLSRFPDGSLNWIKTYATPGFENIAQERIKPKLFIERNNAELNIEVISFPPTKVILQISYDLKEWNNIYTNNVPEVSFSYPDSGFKDGKESFYRAVEYVE